ncbi:MAG: 16S rRNA (uracil(1498)-N(3))-methyltransferase [Leptothrix ochracea]|uniref:16S rRNA (uracil(1498)-N(3))-methyltransferase n=1 Tax=Leptothrix ochracea TaxID=735331 RepID=UPI0034E2B4AA
MPPRFYVDLPLQTDLDTVLPEGPAKHVQVLRLQPGEPITLFNGRQQDGRGEWSATITRMGRQEVAVRVGSLNPVERELPQDVSLAAGMPANDRFDWLVEKATELGVQTIQPLMCERSVLRLSGERAAKKVAHWQAVAIAAAEQCGRTRVPHIAPMQTLAAWLAGLNEATVPAPGRLILSLGDAKPLSERLSVLLPTAQPICLLSGPEGGLSPAEEGRARDLGFMPTSLGARVLRAETAPLMVLCVLGGVVGAAP